VTINFVFAKIGRFVGDFQQDLGAGLGINVNVSIEPSGGLSKSIFPD
jgi:hypothetical protein